jgi:hypothetical protein
MMAISEGRAAVRRLRRGVVAANQVTSLSVGLEEQSSEIRKQLRLLCSGSAQACFVEGEWGTGKSHLLALTAELAIESGAAVAYLNLNGQNAAINHPQRFYHLIAARLKTAHTAPGISDLLQHLFAQPVLRAKLLEWVMLKDRTSELALAIRSLIDSKDADNAFALSLVLGTDLSWADYGYKREKALKRIADLGQCLWHCGLSGLALELDELETLDQLWNSRSRKGAYEVLGRLIQMQHVLPIFAVTARFRSIVHQDATSIPDLGTAGLEFINGWQRKQYPLLRATELTRYSALKLARRIESLYAQAYGTPSSHAELGPVVGEWSGLSTRSPRALLRRVVHHLDVNRNGSEPAIRARPSAI